MVQIPRESFFSSFRNFKKEGYEFISKRCRFHKSELFQIDLLIKTIICISGADAAALFYDESKFKRKGAIPKRVQKTLFGRKSIHTKDDKSHQERKAMFLSVMTEENIRQLAALVERGFRSRIRRWENSKEVHLFTEARQIIFEAVCTWAGVPLSLEEIEERADDMIAMIDSFGAMGKRYLAGRQARVRSEKWMTQIIREVRTGRIEPQQDCVLSIVSGFQDHNREELDDRMAAIEMLNFIRPTVAISYYMLFALLALKEHPEYKQKLRDAEPGFLEKYIHEVRRFYAFAPFLGAVVKHEFSWKGYQFPKDALVMLDVYGTNHDEKYWARPNEFFPYNFDHWDKSPFDFIPQGGGSFNGHRCPGEWITVEILKSVIQFFSKVDFEFGDQDLSYDLTRLPTYPQSGVILKNIHTEAKILQER